ncbi:MAG: very short patch repair endonuclease [Chloroflexi bacterium]|nr:very short patch repair endonuclease [Chloroflexota bacterium]PWB43762.1 MAG: very short patch repair endonuclease [Dehalococcoidia bacterium]
MAAIRSRNTKPEIAVRRALHAAGYRFRVDSRHLPGRPDIVLPRYRLAVFVHGCFWHGHGCRRDHIPSTNPDYWRAKLDRNRRRDRRAREALRAMGWATATVWECSLASGTGRVIARLERLRATQAAQGCAS